MTEEGPPPDATGPGDTATLARRVAAPRAADVNPRALGLILDSLDRRLGEVSRRNHRFSWLRDPDSGDWLAVDAYYPAARLVVVAAEDSAIAAAVAAEVPSHGMFWLRLSSAELLADPAAVARALEARLTHAGWSGGAGGVAAPNPGPAPGAGPVRATERGMSEGRVTAAGRTPAAGRGPAAGPARRSSAADGVWLGLALVGAVALELVVGTALIGLNHGRYILALGFLLDAAARVLGTVAASQRDDLTLAWTSVAFGSAALWAEVPSAPTDRVDMAGPARVTALTAGGMLALGVLIAIL
jgi:hypothetical protein